MLELIPSTSGQRQQSSTRTAYPFLHSLLRDNKKSKVDPLKYVFWLWREAGVPREINTTHAWEKHQNSTRKKTARTQTRPSYFEAKANHCPANHHKPNSQRIQNLMALWWMSECIAMATINMDSVEDRSGHNERRREEVGPLTRRFQPAEQQMGINGNNHKRCCLCLCASTKGHSHYLEWAGQSAPTGTNEAAASEFTLKTDRWRCRSKVEVGSMV